MLPYNTSSFSNTLDATDRPAQRKAVVAPFKEDFDGKIENVLQHIANFTHRCHETGVIEDFNFIAQEHSPPDDVDMDDQKERLAWLADPRRFTYGNLLIDSSTATLEKLQAARDTNKAIVMKQTSRPDPVKMPIVSKNLVSFQNRSWIYILLQTVWTVSMKAIMSKYQEIHDNDGVLLWFCFLRHFAGTTKENISQACALLTESKLRLTNFNNNILKFTNYVRHPIRRLLKANEQPTYQHFIDIFHCVMEAPNDEFKAFAIALYTDYRKDGPTSKMSMLELLDHFDVEYTRLDNLGRWTKKEDSTMLALLSSFQSLQSKFAALQSEYVALQAQSQNSSKDNNNNSNINRIKLNKPPPRKENEPEIVDFEGYQWKWCEKCFGGSWNRTHITSEYQPGKGRSKTRQRQPPEASSALLAITPAPTPTEGQPQANIATPQSTTDVTPAPSNSLFADFY
jgi:hypothetical protein